MKSIVICPDRRTGVAFLSRRLPLALVPVLGPSLLSHWLTALAEHGAKEVLVLASDRPDVIRAAVGRGETWGLNIEVRAGAAELSVTEARQQFHAGTAGWLAAPHDVVTADHLPALPGRPLFESTAGFFAALKTWQPQAGKHRLGAREIAPGIWAGLGCRVDSTAKLIAPGWLGENVWVRSRATVGPDAFVEDSAMVDNDVELSTSWVGPRTYIGSWTQVRHSLAWSDGLLNHATNSFAEIVDPFLLGDLRGAPGCARTSSWFGRVAALMAAALTSPVLPVAWLKWRGRGDLFLKRRAVIPTSVAGSASLREMDYFELNGITGFWRRWPQLWSIVRGDFSWVGNRPLTRSQATQLESEFDQLWLSAPVGLVSLADTFGCGEKCDDAARVHSSFYAVRGAGRLDREILRQFIRGALFGN